MQTITIHVRNGKVQGTIPVEAKLRLLLRLISPDEADEIEGTVFEMEKTVSVIQRELNEFIKEGRKHDYSQAATFGELRGPDAVRREEL